MPRRSQRRKPTPEAEDTTLAARLDEWRARHPPRRRFLVGVSGGCDSVVLVDLLGQLGYRRLVLCHLNHGLRGRASGHDAAFVRRLARRTGLPLIVEKRDVATAARERGTSLETTARDVRFAFFRDVATRTRCPRLILAHHADDQLETVVMNFFRGAGIAGLAGMREESERHDLVVLRPLLNIRRAELECEAARRGLRWREDASNLDPAFTRNRVRHELLPRLAKVFGREVTGPILRAAALARDDGDLLDRLATDASPACLGGSGALRTRALLAQPVALQRRILQRWLREAGATDLGFEAVERVRRIAPPDASTARVAVGGGFLVRRRRGELIVTLGPPSLST